MASHLVFVYGTLKRGFHNQRVMHAGDHSFVGEGVTVDRYLFTASGIPFVHPVSEHMAAHPRIARLLCRVKGELWEMDDAALAACDRLEGHPEFYERTPCHVVVDGKTLEAGIYLHPGPLPGMQPVPRNAEGIAEWRPARDPQPDDDA